MKTAFSLISIKKIIIPIILAFIIISILIWFLPSKIFLISWDFRNNLWAPAYLLWRGESVYDIRILFDHCNAIWFPQVIGMFFPLGLLPQPQAIKIWLSLNIILLIILILFLSWQVEQKWPLPIILGIITLTVFLFPPTIRHLILGQIDIIIVMTLVASAYALERNRLTFSGFLFTIALVKPQLCVMVLPSAVYFLLLRRGWRDVIKLFLMICIFAFTLTIPLWISNPKWTSDFLTNLKVNPQWLQPALISLLYTKFGKLGLIEWFFLFTATLIISLRLWTKNDPKQAVLWSMALTTIVGPYVWSWDFILLLPLIIDTAIRLTNTLARFTLFIFYAFCFVLSVILLQIPGSSDRILWWIPFVMMIGIIISLQLSKKYSKKEGSDCNFLRFHQA